MNTKHLYGGLVVALSLGLVGCSVDVTPIDTDFGATSTGDTTAGNTSNTQTTDTSTTDVPTTSDTTVSPTSDATTGGTTAASDATTGGTSEGTAGGSTEAGSSTGEPVASCEDAIVNQDETDVDCGGLTCGGCVAGQMCLDTPDCAEGACIGGICTVGACDDGILNLNETDIDCGGACPACGLGQACLENVDCAEGACLEGVCTMVDCLQDADCDAQDTACGDASCDLVTYTCVVAPLNEGGDCDDGDLCSTTSICTAGACTAGELVDCSALDGACAVGSCNPEDGQCVAAPANEGMACDDANNCTAASTCTAGTCGDPMKPGYVLNEDFSDNAAGWKLDANWAIGAAVAGCGDPGADHSASADNGVAGVVLGGCAPTGPVDAAKFFCLTSPVVDTTGMAKVFVNYWRDLWSDYAPYMKNKIEVWNGNAWVIVFETFGAPEVNDAAWKTSSYDLTAHSNAALQVRWCYNIGSGGAFNRGSWNVDDVVIGETAECAPAP